MTLLKRVGDNNDLERLAARRAERTATVFACKVPLGADPRGGGRRSAAYGVIPSGMQVHVEPISFLR